MGYIFVWSHGTVSLCPDSNVCPCLDIFPMIPEFLFFIDLALFKYLAYSLCLAGDAFEPDTGRDYIAYYKLMCKWG